MCYPTSVEKTSIYLADTDRRRLAELARREGVSQAELVRRAINAYTTVARGDRDFVSARSFDGPGDMVGGNEEEDLLQGFGE